MRCLCAHTRAQSTVARGANVQTNRCDNITLTTCIKQTRAPGPPGIATAAAASSGGSGRRCGSGRTSMMHRGSGAVATCGAASGSIMKRRAATAEAALVGCAWRRRARGGARRRPARGAASVSGREVVEASCDRMADKIRTSSFIASADSTAKYLLPALLPPAPAAATELSCDACCDCRLRRSSLRRAKLTPKAAARTAHVSSGPPNWRSMGRRDRSNLGICLYARATAVFVRDESLRTFYLIAECAVATFQSDAVFAAVQASAHAIVRRCLLHGMALGAVSLGGVWGWPVWVRAVPAPCGPLLALLVALPVAEWSLHLAGEVCSRNSWGALARRRPSRADISYRQKGARKAASSQRERPVVTRLRRKPLPPTSVLRPMAFPPCGHTEGMQGMRYGMNTECKKCKLLF